MKRVLLLLTLLCATALGAIAQTSPCNPIAVTNASPWLDDFSTAPTCWSFPTDNINSSWMWDDEDQDIYHDYGSYESDVLSPILDISAVTTPYLKFSQKRTDFSFSDVSDELYVYYRSTAAGEDSTWFLLGAYTAVCNDWFIDSIPLPQYLTTIQFKFHAVGNGDLANGVNIDFVSVYNEENAPSCIAPSALNVFNIGNYSAELSWALVSSGNVDLYYKVVSDSIYNLVETPMLSDGVFLLDNLETATQYVWYLDMDCGGESVQTPLHYFTTGCGLISAPYNEGFEYVNPGKNPPCWNSINSVTEGTYTFPGVSNILNTYAHTGSLSYKFKNSSDAQYAIMPEFDNVFSSLQLNFWTRREGSGSGTFSVGYVTDPQADSSFVSLLTISGSQLGDNSYYNFTVRYDSVPVLENTHYYIAFKYECTSTWFWYIDDISVTEITPCMTPDSLTACNATGSSIDLSWTGNADEYTVYYRVVGETVYAQNDNVTLNASGVYTLTGLTPSTNYEWYVEAYCNDGTTVSSFIIASFTTECGPLAAVPVNWDLEDNLTAGTPSYPLPTCWSRIAADASHIYVHQQSSNAHSGNKSLRFYNRYPNSHAVLPAVDNTVLSFSNLQLSFYAKTTFTNAAVSLEVGVMTDPEDASTFTAVGAVTPSETYTLYEIPFLSYTGSGNYIAIRNVSTSTGNVWSYFHVDDISLTSVANCTPPINLTATPSTHSATLSWVSTGSTFTLHYKEADSDTWQTESNVSLDSNNEYELTGLTDGTAYDWYVETACGISPEQESTQAYFTTIMEAVDLPYQTDFSNSEEWLMNNGHAGNFWRTGIPYGDTETALFITCLDGSIAEYNTTTNAVVTAEKAFNMPEGSSVHVEFDVLIGGEGGYNPADYLKVFLAPNTTVFNVGATSSNAQSAAGYSTHAFNFSDYIWQTGENNYPYKLNLTQDSTLHISMNVDNPDINGEAKIVFLWRNDDYLGTQPSAIIRNFLITDDTTYTPPTPPTPLTCTTPSSVSVNNIGHSSADVSWTAGDDETVWNLQYKESSASTWGNSIPVSVPNYHISGLNPETEYQVRVQANCIDTLSDWTTPVNFTTAEEVSIDNITLANSISLMPNPADNYIELNINSNVEVKEAVVYNAFGQMIQTVQLTENHARIDHSNMASGMYFVRVNDEGVSATKKFIKR